MEKALATPELQTSSRKPLRVSPGVTCGGAKEMKSARDLTGKSLKRRVGKMEAFCQRHTKGASTEKKVEMYVRTVALGQLW